MWWVEVGSRNFFKNIYSNLNFNLPSNLRDNPIFFFYCFVSSALFRLYGEDLPVSRTWKKKEREREKYRMRRPQVRCLVPSPLLLNYFRFFSARSGINEVALQINVAWSLKEKKKKRERMQEKDKRRKKKKRVKKKSFNDDDDDDDSARFLGKGETMSLERMIPSSNRRCWKT